MSLRKTCAASRFAGAAPEPNYWKLRAKLLEPEVARLRRSLSNWRFSCFTFARVAIFTVSEYKCS
jgi:hypothetical protein